MTFPPHFYPLDREKTPFFYRDRSKLLLDIAKHGVELAIEKTEKDAEKWIKAELVKMGIKDA